MKYQLAIVDDHPLFTNSFELLLNSFEHFFVCLVANSGQELIQKLSVIKYPPEIVLLDISMPGMSGPEIAVWLGMHHPAIKVAAVTMNNNDQSVLEMMKAGCCSYLLKNIHPVELEKALISIAEKGYYNADSININYKRLLNAGLEEYLLTDRERAFLEMACSDATYKQIAAKMKVAIRTVDGYRDNIFKKFGVESRTGMVLEAVRRGLIKL
jgi:DNA-binding NarL/FixJ family response regulator